MSYDALFQSGMGSVDAPRTEELLRSHASTACPDVFRLASSRRRVLSARVRMMGRQRGNSAKALIPRWIPGTIPS